MLIWYVSIDKFYMFGFSYTRFRGAGVSFFAGGAPDLFFGPNHLIENYVYAFINAFFQMVIIFYDYP